jgi:hypothetical protein
MNESVKPLTSEEVIDFSDKLIKLLTGIYNSAPYDSEFGEPFYEDDFIEQNLLKPYRSKMVPFIKTRLKLYFAKEEHDQKLLFQKLKITEPVLTYEEYQDYITRMYSLLKWVKEHYYLKPVEAPQQTIEEAKVLIDEAQELESQGFKSRSKEYTRARQILMFHFLLKLAGMTRLNASARKFAQFAHFLFRYPTDNIDGSEIYKLIKQAPYVKEGKALIKELEFVKKQFELIECTEGVDLVQKEIDSLTRR